MNSVERVRTSLLCQIPDRVPIVEFLIDDQVARAAVPGCRDTADCMDRLGLDAVACGSWFEKKAHNGTYEDEWGVTYKACQEAVDHPLSGPIRTMDDLRKWQAPDPHRAGRLGALPSLVERYKGKRSIIFHHRAAFMWAAYLMDMDSILVSMLAAPEFVHAVMDEVLDANMEIVRSAIHAGAEIIVLGDDYAYNAGPMMSPDLFRTFILPRLTKMIEMIHDEGALCIKHSDGNIYPLIDMIVQAGPDGLNPIEPSAGMDLKTVKSRFNGKLCLCGNIDCGHLLPHGSPEQVCDAVQQAIRDAGEGGGYILSSSNSIHSSCRAENLKAMVEAGKIYGKYSS